MNASTKLNRNIKKLLSNSLQYSKSELSAKDEFTVSVSYNTKIRVSNGEVTGYER